MEDSLVDDDEVLLGIGSSNSDISFTNVDDECESVIADDPDTWEELAAEEEEEIVDLEFSNEKEVEQNLIAEIKSDERLWREKGNNSNVRGAGTSKSTYKRIRQKQLRI